MSLQDRISASIACTYDAALDRADWAAALRQISDLLGGTAASLHFGNTTGGRVIADDRISEEAKSEYRSYYRPGFAVIRQTAVNSLISQ